MHQGGVRRTHRSSVHEDGGIVLPWLHATFPVVTSGPRLPIVLGGVILMDQAETLPTCRGGVDAVPAGMEEPRATRDTGP
eukprot:1984219-Rhodomonas_salina.1